MWIQHDRATFFEREREREVLVQAPSHMSADGSVQQLEEMCSQEVRSTEFLSTAFLQECSAQWILTFVNINNFYKIGEKV